MHQTSQMTRCAISCAGHIRQIMVRWTLKTENCVIVPSAVLEVRHQQVDVQDRDHRVQEVVIAGPDGVIRILGFFGPMKSVQFFVSQGIVIVVVANLAQLYKHASRRRVQGIHQQGTTAVVAIPHSSGQRGSKLLDFTGQES